MGSVRFPLCNYLERLDEAMTPGGVRNKSRRSFLRSASFAAVVGQAHFALAAQKPAVATELDKARMRELVAWTMLTMKTASPVPFGAEIFDTKTGVSLMRATNNVSGENDPSSHAEVRTIRLACSKLGSPSLAGYTLYTTCEPCPMCMSDSLWAGLDRVVYGATIADANRFCKQIRIPASEVAARSDMTCEVVGPVEQAACVELFTNPTMQAAFKTWTSKK
jgi:tRNA(Arg) A34 adenosine deaminase TadA